jgi:hypothetical protein
MTVPVVGLCLPSPKTFQHLLSYLYIKRTYLLLKSLLPESPPRQLEIDESVRVPFAMKLAGKFTALLLLQYIKIVDGLWQNVCALGVFDDDLWDTMDLAWEVLLTALAIGTGNPTAMARNTSVESQAEPSPSHS